MTLEKFANHYADACSAMGCRVTVGLRPAAHPEYGVRVLCARHREYCNEVQSR